MSIDSARSLALDPSVLALVACPACRGEVSATAEALICDGCGRSFAIQDGIPLMEVHERSEALSRELAWYEPAAGTGRLAPVSEEPPKTPARPSSHDLAHGLARQTIADALQQLGADTSWTVLSIATGAGIEVPFIERVSRRIVGVDLSVTALRRFRRCYPYPVFQGNVLALPFRDGAFDACVVSGLLHHVVGYDTLGPYLKEFGRVLRSGGGIVVIEPNSLYPVQWVLGPVNRVVQRIRPGWRGLVPHERPISPPFMVRSLRQAGFVDLHARGATFLHSRMPLWFGQELVRWESRFHTVWPFSLLGWWTVVTGRRPRH